MPADLANQVALLLSSFHGDVDRRSSSWLKTRSGEDLRAMELELAELARGLADGISGAFLAEILSTPEFQESTRASARAPGEYRSGGLRDVEVTFLGGSKQKFQVPYLKDKASFPGFRYQDVSFLDC